MEFMPLRVDSGLDCYEIRDLFGIQEMVKPLGKVCV